MQALQVTQDTTVLAAAAPIPALGHLPVNSFVIKSKEPVLVDTGMAPDVDEFLALLGAVIDPAEIRYIWLTHSDRDHTGALMKMLELAPNAKVVCQFITLGIMGAGWEPIPPERAHVVRDGSTLDVGDRTLTAFRPPLFDNPGTVGFYDPKQNLIISSDFLGAPMPSEQDAFADDVASVTEDDVVAGQLVWGSVDAPWVHNSDESKLAETVSRFASFGAGTVLSTHLPPIRSNLDRHLKTVLSLPSAEPFMAPDQAALEAAMGEIAH